MIKLIASDLDGTLLLNGSQSLNPGTIDIIKQLHEMGIVFAAASGRQFANLQRLFEPVKDEIAYICENGALVVYKGQILSKTFIERSVGEEILECIRNREGCEILLSGLNTSYLEPKAESYANHMRYVVKNNVTVVKDILEVTEDYLKISVCEKEGIQNSEAFFKEKFKDKVNVVTSGNLWLDMIPLGVNKGSAMAVLQERLSIKPDESMAFGDHFNDVEMMQSVKYSYAMDKGQKEILKMCSFHTDMVEKTLKDVILGKIV